MCTEIFNLLGSSLITLVKPFKCLAYLRNWTVEASVLEVKTIMGAGRPI